MGMFDDIRVEYKLPLPKDLGELSENHFNSNTDYQTKSLHNLLDHYEIREDGSLWIEDREGVYIEGDPKGKSITQRLGHFKTLKEWQEPHKYTGNITFYNSVPDNSTRDNFRNDYWIEYTAKIVEGKLESVELDKFTATPNAERKHSDNVYNKKDKLISEFQRTFFYRYFYKYYLKVIRISLRGFYKATVIFAHLWRINKIEQYLDFMTRRINNQSGVTALRKSCDEKFKIKHGN